MPADPTLPRLCARSDREAAATLGVSRTTLWRLTNLPERDPRKIRRTSYGKIPLAELQRHVAADVEQ